MAKVLMRSKLPVLRVRVFMSLSPVVVSLYCPTARRLMQVSALDIGSKKPPGRSRAGKVAAWKRRRHHHHLISR
jgi:hypothetical protein